MKSRTLLALAVAGATIACIGLTTQDGFTRERSGPTEAAKDALEAKAPPRLTISSWLNSKPLAWKDLKGKVVLIDFWAHW